MSLDVDAVSTLAHKYNGQLVLGNVLVHLNDRNQWLTQRNELGEIELTPLGMELEAKVDAEIKQTRRRRK